MKNSVAVVLAIVFAALAAAQVRTAMRTVLRRSRPWPEAAYELLLVAHLFMGTLTSWVVLRNGAPWRCADAAGADADMVCYLFLLPNLLVCVWGAVLVVRAGRWRMLPELLAVGLTVPPVAWALGAWWPWAVFLDAAVFIVRVTEGALVGERERGRALSRAAMAEAVKALPEGVLFARGDGRVLMMNDAMRARLTGLGFSTDLADARDLWAALERRAHGEGRAGGENQADAAYPVDAAYPAGAVLPEGILLATGDGRTALFSCQEVELRGELLACVVATDVTDQERLAIQIERTNRQLEEAGERLRVSLDGVAQVARNEALAAMRSRVHDVIGQRLSILHRYLEDGAQAGGASACDVPACDVPACGVPFERIAALVAGIRDDLRADLPPDPATDLDAVVDAFSLVGVAVRVRGEVPDDPAVAAAFVRAVREAATNAVRHAQASEVEVAFGRERGAWACAVRNDGALCRAVEREGGGITGMRASLAEVGGSVCIEPGPPFTVRLSAPDGVDVVDGAD